MILSAFLLTASVLFASGQPARAQEAKKTGTSLDLMPVDTAFYGSSLRNREQIEILYKSNAYKTFRALPLVKMGYDSAMAELGKKGGFFEKYRQFTADKSNQELVEVLTEAVSDDCFVYGGKSWGDFVRLLSKLDNARQLAPLQALLSGMDPTKASFRAMLLAAQKDRELVVIPDLVLGFKLRDTKKATAQLGRLEMIAKAMLKDVAPLKGRVTRKKVGGGDFLVADLDGGLIPWEDVNLKDLEENKDEFEELIKHLKKMTLSVSVGIKDGNLLVGVNSTSGHLEKLGGKGKTLASREEFAPLMKFADRPLTGISYTSKELLAAINSTSTQRLTEMAAQAKTLLEKVDQIKEERKKAIIQDIDRYAAEWKKMIPEAGGRMDFSFMTGTGYEGYSYDYSNHDKLKGIKSDLHNHFGGDPILAAAFAFKVDGTSYAELSKFFQTVYGHGMAVVLDLAPNDEARDEVKNAANKVVPVFKRLDAAISKQLLPAMKEGGLGIVLDAKWSSKQWVKELPEMPRAMPMLELGLMLGISDAKGFEGAAKEIRLTLNDFFEKLSEVSKNNIPEFKIPAPESEKGKNGTLFYFNLPEDTGLDKQFMPTMGVGKRTSVVTLSKAHAERLLGPKPLAVKGTALDRKGDLIGAGVLNWNALVDAAAPWIEFGVRTAFAKQAEGKKDGEPKKGVPQAEEVLKQVKVGLTVLKCFKGATSATFLEDGKLVTHTRIAVKDLAAAPAKD